MNQTDHQSSNYSLPSKLSEEELNLVYNWVDEIPLSRPKRNISRDFADGVLIAEILHYYLPRMVELHNYSAANSVRQKRYNWDTLNNKVLKKYLDIKLSNKLIENIINAVPEDIEKVLRLIQVTLESYLQNPQNIPQVKQNSPPRPQTTGFSGQSYNYNAKQGQGLNNYQQISIRQNLHPQSSQPRFQNQSQVFAKQQQLQESQVNQDIVWEKDQQIQELKETIDILELKIKKMEDFLKLKDHKIQHLQDQLAKVGLI